MSLSQQSLYAILEDLSSQYASYARLQVDPRFQTWIKHVPNKRMAVSYLKSKFAERERELQQQKESIPLYF